MKAGVAVLAVLIVAGCGASGTATSGATQTPTERPTVAATQSRPAAPALKLADIVLAPDAAPPGTGNDRVVEGAPVLLRPVVSGRDAEFLALEGFVAGRFTEFSGDAGLLLSLALLFESAGHAERAFELYLDELESDKGYGVGEGGVEAGLGAQGTCAEFDNPALGGIHENACLWHHDTLVLIAGGTFDPDDVHSIAEDMDTKASLALRQ